jgi:DNA-binding PadR family transcriptional regulator
MARHHSLAQFELLVMAAVVRLRDDAYAVQIRREIETRSGRPAAMGAVYAALGRLEDKGLLRHGPASLPPWGRTHRKRFVLTAAGTRELAEATSMLARMLEGLLPVDGSPS